MSEVFHPLVKQLLDGELSLADLPPEVQAEGAEALRLLSAVDRAPVSLSAALDTRVMEEVRRRTARRRAWRWLVEPRVIEVRLRVRPWAIWGGALAAAATVALLISRPWSPSPAGGVRPVQVVSRDSIFVRFVLHAPHARHVAVAGTFNQWDPDAAPLVRAGAGGIWTTTLAVPLGQHQYAFVVDGERWIADPAAPALDDGFGRRNSMIAVTAKGAWTL